MDNSTTQAGMSHGHGGAEAAMSRGDRDANVDDHFRWDGLFGHLQRDMAHADEVYAARFVALNNSGVSGDALLFADGDSLTVVVAAEGLEANVHPFHIHGLPNGMDSTVPTLAQDTDGDGFVELAEGAATYGPIVLNLTTNPEAAVDVPPGVLRADLAFPTVGEDGRLFYAQTFRFEGEGQADAILRELMPLENRHMVLHGASVNAGQGAGSGGEVDGSAGYKLVLPVANAEIVQVSGPLGAQLALLNVLTWDDATTVASTGDYAFMA